MKLTFLGKTFENTESNHLVFKNKDSLLIINVFYHTICLTTNIDGGYQNLFSIDHTLKKQDYKNQDLIQKILDDKTNQFILSTAKMRDHCHKVAEGYSSIINGLELFI